MSADQLEERIPLARLSRLSGRTIQTLRNDIAEERLDAIKIGGRWYVTVTVAELYLGGYDASPGRNGHQ